jgi:hypothetical protein
MRAHRTNQFPLGLLLNALAGQRLRSDWLDLA